MTDPTFPLPIGTVLPEGTITETSLTAYRVVSEAGAAWVPFVRVHRPERVEGLVTFGDGSRYGGAVR